MRCGVFSTIPPREIFRNLWLSDCQVLCLPFEPCLKFIIGDVHEVLRRAALCFAEAPTTWPMLVVKGHHRRWARDRSFASLRMTVPALVVKGHHQRSTWGDGRVATSSSVLTAALLRGRVGSG